jgi:hypothetical protein
MTMTRRTLRRLRGPNERLELPIALFTGVFVQGHRD